MTTAEIIRNMIAYSKGNRHGVNHFMKVYSFTGSIRACKGPERVSRAETGRTLLRAMYL